MAFSKNSIRQKLLKEIHGSSVGKLHDPDVLAEKLGVDVQRVLDQLNELHRAEDLDMVIEGGKALYAEHGQSPVNRAFYKFATEALVIC